MNHPRVVDQELIVHLYAPTAGPRAADAYAELQKIWTRCRQLLGMVNPIPGVTVSNRLPSALEALPAPADPLEQEGLVAAQEAPRATYQAVLRHHHDVLNLSVALSPQGGPLDDLAAPAGTPRQGWAEWDQLWAAVAVPWSGALLGSVQIRQAKLASGQPTAGVSLGQSVRPLLPAGPESQDWCHHGVRTPHGFALWETGPQSDARGERQLLVLAGADQDGALSAWTWSRGDGRIPPLARYLLHAAKVRYQLRVWSDATRTGPLERLSGAAPGLQAVLAAVRAGDLSAESVAAMHDGDLEAVLYGAQLRRLRRTIEIAQDNMGRSLGGRRGAAAFRPRSAGRRCPPGNLVSGPNRRRAVLSRRRQR